MARLDKDMFVLVQADQRQTIEDVRKYFQLKTQGDAVRACVRLCERLLKDGTFDGGAFLDSLEAEGVKVGTRVKDTRVKDQNGLAKKIDEKIDDLGDLDDLDDEDVGCVNQDVVNKVVGKKTGRKGRRGRPGRFVDEQIRAIRAEFAEGSITFKELAKRFNCSYPTIQRIVQRKTYADVADRDWDKEMARKD